MISLLLTPKNLSVLSVRVYYGGIISEIGVHCSGVISKSGITDESVL